ncbi:MAG: helix-turn-helix domain-containing protein [Alphaproteobacteria bacterium GM202ARS2]|nr:helix-turn-helix domain-containing protein [Alphaproteobacteria bacterium GM202ARS2]
MHATKPRPQALRVAEIAKILGCSTDLVYRQIHAGKLPSFKFGGVIRVWLHDLPVADDQSNSLDGTCDALADNGALKNIRSRDVVDAAVFRQRMKRKQSGGSRT